MGSTEIRQFSSLDETNQRQPGQRRHTANVFECPRLSSHSQTSRMLKLDLWYNTLGGINNYFAHHPAKMNVMGRRHLGIGPEYCRWPFFM
jgi:hypothetical protein